MTPVIATVITAGISTILVIFGWVIAHRFNLERDAIQKRRDLRVTYLLDAYRRLEDLSGRSGEDLKLLRRAFESAVGDVQLLGTTAQIDVLLIFLRQFVNNTNADINPLLDLIRQDIRRDLNLESEVPLIHQFRFKPDPTDEKASDAKLP